MRPNVHVTSQPARKVSPSLRCAGFGYSHMPDRSTKWTSEMSQRVRVKALWKGLLSSFSLTSLVVASVNPIIRLPLSLFQALRQ